MFTRFHDDPAKINIQNQQSTDQSRWILNTPGNGDRPEYMMDAYVIPQKWGGNLWSNAIDVQSLLLGLDQPLGKDCLGKPTRDQNLTASPNKYADSNKLMTDQSRAIMPSWTVRDLPQFKPAFPLFNPQENTTIKFPSYLNTRILEKDSYDSRL